MATLTGTHLLGMGGFLLLPLLVIALIIIGAGIGAGLFACAVAAVLIMLGVVSSSAALGFLTKRPATALRAFLLQCGILAGIPAGAVAAWIGHGLVQYLAEIRAVMPGSMEWQIPLFGAAGGALGGAVLALSIDFILRRSHAWLRSQVKQPGEAAR